MSCIIDIEWNDDELRRAVQEAFESEAFGGSLEYECPECGRGIRITGPSNICACGFALNVELGKVEL